MATKSKTVKGIKMADHIDPARLDWGRPASPEFIAAAKRKPKVRITTMLDEDVVAALKRIAAESSEDIGYQTVLNILLRASLFPETSKPKRKAKAGKAS